MTFDSDAALRLIAESLGLVDRVGADPIDVRDVSMSDRTLVVEIAARSTDRIMVRGEIAGVMGALSGLDVPALFPVLHAESFGVRAFDGAGEELLWIVSSIDAAGFAGDGRPVEWMANSLTQDNTPAYRRSQADRVIGQIETGLRELLDHHGRQRVGDAYVEQLWSDSELSKFRGQADAEGRDDVDGRVLLDYVFLPQLRDAIVDHGVWFDDGCLPDPEALRESLGALNKVRRKVAHHREITSDELEDCRAINRTCLTPLGRTHPDLLSDFLVDRWEDQMAMIVDTMQAGFGSSDPPPAGSIPETDRRHLAVEALDEQQQVVREALRAFDCLVVPPLRAELHKSAVEALTHWQAALGELVSVGSRGDPTVAEAEDASAVYAETLGRVRDVSQQIKQMRVDTVTD